MTRIRVLVVEDSLTVRRYLLDILGQDPDIQVVGEAVDGQQAMALCQKLRPDVITLDLAMPVVDGLAVTEYIMAHFPTPILIISGSRERGEVFKTYDALAAGAIEVMEKPLASDLASDWERKFLAMVKMVSRIKVITHLRGRMDGSRRYAIDKGAVEQTALAIPQKHASRIVAIGTSTGGPAALTAVLSSLNPGYPWPILVVIHLSLAFGNTFAEWLGRQITLPVSLADDGQLLSDCKGRVLIAPPDQHLVVRGSRLRLTQDPLLHSCRPSVDVLFSSLAIEQRESTIACLLTGMGKDGAQGLLAIRQMGGHTMAEDASTAIVFGMPAEAIKLNAATMILPLPKIGPHLNWLAETDAGVRSR
jgi:two-component system chemotaxis response regulator CheB